MLLSARRLFGYRIVAKDGHLGSVHDLYFDDKHWTVRYFVVDTGGWLSGRLVLLSPVALTHMDLAAHTIAVDLTKRRVQDSPSIGTELPVSRQHEIQLHQHYRWPVYWGGGMFPAGVITMFPEAVWSIQRGQDEKREEQEIARYRQTEEQTRDDPHLRSVREVTGYHVQATDGEIGHIEDFIADDQGWALRYMEVATRNWLPGRKVLVMPEWIEKVRWEESKVYVGVPRSKIRRSIELNDSALTGRRDEKLSRPGGS